MDCGGVCAGHPLLQRVAGLDLMNRTLLLHIAAALVTGLGLRVVLNLEPVWWAAWVVPGLLFALALRNEARRARGLIALAALIGASVNVPFLLRVMPLVPVTIIILLQTLLWVLVLGGARRIVKAFDSAWTLFALPVLAVAVDTLLAHFTPDGNWGSLAYTQMDVLPGAQIAAVAGAGGILFMLMIVNSAIGLALNGGLRRRSAPLAFGAGAVLLAAALGYGFWRLQVAPAGSDIAFGLASVDDAIENLRIEQSRDVWAQYQAQVTDLAGRGARVVLLPEKIAVLSTPDAEARKQWLANIAREHGIWLVAGLGVDTGHERRNEAWWFAPDGRVATTYLKHFMAPPEREFVAGNEFPVNVIDGVRYGVAICKDMHFASLGRGFGARDAAVMLVPAWDFQADASMAANMTRLRGIENGYTIVRSARNGLLTISDAYGRMLAIEQSATLPGTTLFKRVTVGPRVATIYTRIGDSLGWMCVAGAAFLTALSLLRARRPASPR
jgi:apolipoprotein N-acyltransferase